jgi:hypothetical protein
MRKITRICRLPRLFAFYVVFGEDIRICKSKYLHLVQGKWEQMKAMKDISVMSDEEDEAFFKMLRHETYKKETIAKEVDQAIATAYATGKMNAVVDLFTRARERDRQESN